jgi:hypothetical protein
MGLKHLAAFTVLAAAFLSMLHVRAAADVSVAGLPPVVAESCANPCK